MLLAVYAALIIAASILGGWLPSKLHLTHTRLQVVISAVAGFMLGVGLLHLLGHALLALEPIPAMLAVLVGFTAMFLLERFFSFHTHEIPGDVCADVHEADHTDHDHHAHQHEHPHRPLSWTGATVGLSIHSVVAGFALGSSVLAEGGAKLPGIAVFLAIVLHKPLDSFTVLTLGHRAGFSTRAANLLNGAFALAVPIGIAIAWFALGSAEGLHDAHAHHDHDHDHDHGDAPPWLPLALAFSAGTFLCVSLSDLLPEVHFHQHDRIKLTAALLLGLGLAVASALAENAIAHG